MSIAEASSQKDKITPKENINPCLRVKERLCPAIFTKLMTLKEMTGKTQGIKFKIMPPIKAKTKAIPIPPSKVSEEESDLIVGLPIAKGEEAAEEVSRLKI